MAWFSMEGNTMNKDVMTLGGYHWRILDRKDDAALLITEQIIEQRPYHDKYVATTWADCALRQYLNGAFLDRFPDVDKARILEVPITNRDNPWYGTEGGPDTLDRVFLLDVEEVVCRYFGDSSNLLHTPKKNQRYWFERKDPNNKKRSTSVVGDPEQIWWWWWLRTPGRVGVKNVYVHGDGNIGIQGNNILIGNLADGRCTGGVRPAMWVKL